jgi:hypothetical protein
MPENVPNGVVGGNEINVEELEIDGLLVVITH